jgi:acyl-CoA reductase-like NAD-dependent aldehyde dehydrogenase
MSVIENIRPQPQAELRHVRMLIDGSWVDSLSGVTLTVENPAKRKPIATIPRGDAADVAGAVDAAARAFPAWSKVAPRDRGRLLLRIADKMEAEAEEIARTIALETGNALRTQARGEARLAADIFRYFGGLAGELKGETIPLGEQVLSYTRREPLGVVGAIIPWNAPVLLAALKIAPALCAGNTLVLKAAEDAPPPLLGPSCRIAALRVDSDPRGPPANGEAGGCFFHQGIPASMAKR